MSLSLHALNPVASITSDMPVASHKPPASTSKDEPSVPPGSWSAPRRQRVASTPSYPAVPTSRTLSFMRQMRQGLESAAQADNRALMPGVPPRTPGWRSPLLHELMSADATVLVPPGTAAPDSSIADMGNSTRAAIEYYLATQNNPFDGLTAEGREYARSAIVALLVNVKQPEGTPGRLEDSQIPVALRMIDVAAKSMGRPATAPTSTAATSLTAPPRRLPFDEPHQELRIEAIVRKLNDRPGNEPGLLDVDAWTELLASTEPVLREQVAARAFHDYRRVLSDAYASSDWTDVRLPKVLLTLQGMRMAAAFGAAPFEIDSLQGWPQAAFQHNTIANVRNHQQRIDQLMQQGDTPQSRLMRPQLRVLILHDVNLLSNGIGVPEPDSIESAVMVRQALLQYERLLDQLREGDSL